MEQLDEKTVWDGYINNNNSIVTAKTNNVSNESAIKEQGEWEKFLDSLLIELGGFDSSHKSINYYKLSHNMNQLRYVKYEYFRSIIFECMGLLSKIK